MRPSRSRLRTRIPKDLAAAIPNQFRNEAPYNTLIGPTQPRTGANGLIIRRGSVIAEWGDTDRADMTSASQRRSCQRSSGSRSTAARSGVLLIASRSTCLRAWISYAPITWEHLLRQTSDWSGTLWGKPDWADRPPRNQNPTQWEQRELHEPGSLYKYNDTRINVLALAALYVLKRPLPEVLDESIMTTIGASSS